MNLFELFLICLKASALSFGGSAPLPLLHDELGRQRNLLTDADFGVAVAIGRIAPGPNGLLMLPLGYFVAGIPGALVAAAAVYLVSVPVLVLLRIHGWLGRYAVVSAAIKGVQAGAIGLTLSVGYSIVQGTAPTLYHAAITAAAFALVAFTRVDVLLVLAGAGALGLATLLRGS